MIKPKALHKNSTIGIVSPSYWLDDKVLSVTSKYFSDLGYRIEFGKSNNLKWGPFAGSPQDRADDIREPSHSIRETRENERNKKKRSEEKEQK